MFWKRKADPVERCAHALFEAIVEYFTIDGRIRGEDVITGLATVAAERCMLAAGDFNFLEHEFVPGSAVFSTNVNELICGDKDWKEAPPMSVVGILYARLKRCGYTTSDFPRQEDVFGLFAAHAGEAELWGKVPLSIPADHHPSFLPLRFAYATRSKVSECLLPLESSDQALKASVLALAEALCKVGEILDRRIALTLALETVNGMAKTAPITNAALAKLKSGQSQ